MKIAHRIIGVGAAALATAVVLAAPASAYPGPDGYDSGYCWADGVKMGVSNYRSGTGQIVAINVDDHSGYANLSRVQFSSSIATFTATKSLSRVEIYRSNPNEVPWLTMYTNIGTSCSLKLDGSM